MKFYRSSEIFLFLLWVGFCFHKLTYKPYTLPVMLPSIIFKTFSRLLQQISCLVLQVSFSLTSRLIHETKIWSIYFNCFAHVACFQNLFAAFISNLWRTQHECYCFKKGVSLKLTFCYAIKRRVILFSSACSIFPQIFVADKTCLRAFLVLFFLCTEENHHILNISKNIRHIVFLKTHFVFLSLISLLSFGV